MAFSSLYNSCSMIFLFGILFVLTSNLFAIANGASVLENVCHQTKAKSLCLRVLGSNPRSKTANPKELAEIAIDLAKENAIVTKSKIRQCIDLTEDPNHKELCHKCHNFYVEALSALRIAFVDLIRRRDDDLKTHAQHVSDAANSCEATFKNKTCPFTSGNQELEVLGQAIAVIADDLAHSKKHTSSMDV